MGRGGEVRMSLQELGILLGRWYDRKLGVIQLECFLAGADQLAVTSSAASFYVVRFGVEGP